MVPPACSSSSGRGPDPASSAGHCDQHLPTTRRGIFADFSKQQRTSVSSGRNASAPGSTAEAAMGQQCISNMLLMHQQGTSNASAMYQWHAFYEQQVRHKQNAMETESAYINLMIPLLSSWMSSTTVALEQENMSINWWKCSRRQSVSFIFCKHIYIYASIKDEIERTISPSHQVPSSPVSEKTDAVSNKVEFIWHIWDGKWSTYEGLLSTTITAAKLRRLHT